MEPKTNGDKRNPDGTFAEGNSGGPGRPTGSISIKDKVRQHLEAHPEDVEEIVKHFVTSNRELMWQMLEGRPQQDVTTAGEKLPMYLPAELLPKNEIPPSTESNSEGHA